MRRVLDSLRESVIGFNANEVFLPTLAEPALWMERDDFKAEDQMWLFEDRKQRPVCLIPEATAIIQRQYDEHWEKTKAKPVRVFYETRCYRYERPQAGRYREFTQFGYEILGGNQEETAEEAEYALRYALERLGLKYEYDNDVTRGLSYYTRNGFEVSCPELGAQKQVAGGGVYKQGVGWAIGVDRLVDALRHQRWEDID